MTASGVGEARPVNPRTMCAGMMWAGEVQPGYVAGLTGAGRVEQNRQGLGPISQGQRFRHPWELKTRTEEGLTNWVVGGSTLRREAGQATAWKSSFSTNWRS